MDQQHHSDAQIEIAELRQQLRRCHAWPAAGDDFLALISQSNWSSPKPTTQDYDLLPQVVEDAQAGLDIGAQYPAFFQKLLAHADLRQDFLAALQQA